MALLQICSPSHMLTAHVLAVNTSMSIDLKDEGVTSVLLHPGWVRTGMTRGASPLNASCASVV